jgi:hypothetical protein
MAGVLSQRIFSIFIQPAKLQRQWANRQDAHKADPTEFAFDHTWYDLLEDDKRRYLAQTLVFTPSQLPARP